jgi:copper chaperone NosL
MMNRSLLLLLILIMLFGAACGQVANTEEPPKIVYGQDVCDRCTMIISEEKYAAAYWTEEGEARRFDDIGGMLANITENSESVASYWVHDFETVEWVRAEEAAYIVDSDQSTPMGFGIFAFATEEQAQAEVDERDRAIIHSFEELLAMNMTMPMEHNHDEHDQEHMEDMADMDHEQEAEGE